MRFYCFVLVLSVFLVNCSSDDVEYSQINGQVVRLADGSGVANQRLHIMTQKKEGSGVFSYNVLLDEVEDVYTDLEGKFSVNLITEPNAFVTITHWGDKEYFSLINHQSYWLDEEIIIPTLKAVKFNIQVINSNPFDENDYIYISLYTDTTDSQTGIENFGVENYSYINEWGREFQTASWTGINVNSIIYFSVAETPEIVKVQWKMRKNGKETNGFSENIPFDMDQTNTFVFEY